MASKSLLSTAFVNKPFQIFLIGALLLGGIYLIGMKMGKDKVEAKIIPLPDNGSGIPAGFNAVWYANNLHRIMTGVHLSGTKDGVFKQVLDLPSKDMLMAVYNQFNALYMKEGHGTLVKWLQDEWYYDWTSGIKDNLINALISLGAK
jgi:hypothetical protein